MKNIRKKQVTTHKQKGYNYARANLEPLRQKLNYFECAQRVFLNAIVKPVHTYSASTQVTNMGHPGSSWGQPLRDHRPSNPSTPRSKFNIAMAWSGSVCYQTGCCKSHLWSTVDREQTAWRAAALRRHVHASTTPDCLLLPREFWYGQLFTVHPGSAENQP